jgi:2,5-diamino-6-(ribosylamino)-4(3H)-pyrimidinone 5'-phosphate reductase
VKPPQKTMPDPPKEDLFFPPQHQAFLSPYLPTTHSATNAASAAPATPPRPFVTVTYASSLDSQISLAPGTQTHLSGPLSKAMTHFLRANFDAVLVGVGTAVADNPSLGCRLTTNDNLTDEPETEGGEFASAGGRRRSKNIRPVVLDPQARWDFRSSRMLDPLTGPGAGPLIVTGVEEPPADMVALLARSGGRYVHVPLVAGGGGGGGRRMEWADILEALGGAGIGSVMVEGGAVVLDSLLHPRNQHLVDSVVVTIAPTWLGQGGVVVSPERRVAGGAPVPVARLKDVVWHQLGDDVVLCGKF